MRRSVTLADNNMGVNPGFILFDRDIADEREYFHLLRDGDPDVVFTLDIEIAERGLAEGADSRERAALMF